MNAIADERFDNYTQAVKKSTRLGGQSICYFTKPGLPEWQSISPAAALLAEHASLPTQDLVLWLGCGHGAAAAALARRFPGAQLILSDKDYIAQQMTLRSLQANQIDNARLLETLSALPERQATFDTAIIDLPKGRALAQRWLAEAWYALRPGGTLFLAGAKDQGVQSAVKDASQLFGPGGVLAYRKGSRVVKWVKESQPGETASAGTQSSQENWFNTPGVAPGTWHQLRIETRLGNLELFSLPGVFSYERLDEGTALLLDTLDIQPGERVLDLGCGYGIIGLLAAQMGTAQVDLLDSNLLAVACAGQNLAAHKIANARALASDGLSAVQGGRYNRILSNPPFHAGKGVDYQMAHAFIEQSWQALETGGELRLVANRFIRYEEILQKFFSQVSTPAETGKYKVLVGRK